MLQALTAAAVTTSSVELLGKLLAAYWNKAWPFALGHGVLVALILRRTYLIRRETAAMAGWRPRAPEPTDAKAVASAGSPATYTLDRFIEECMALGPQGFFVSIADFSDRIDSIVEGLLSDLYNKINMLLIVGIAGSLFGLFEFANSSSHGLADIANGKGAQANFSELLASSMAKAFPVGFVGLVLMLIFQVWATVPESRLRRAVVTAIGRAVVERRKLCRSQAAIVEAAVVSIGQAMKPLENLESTLARTITPVVEEFAKQMEGSLAFFKKQFDALTGASTKIGEAVNAVERSVVAVERNIRILEETAGRLDLTLKAAPAVLATSIELQKEQVVAFQQFKDTSLEAQTQLREALRVFELQLSDVANLYRSTLEQTESALGRQAERLFDAVQVKAAGLVASLSEGVAGAVATGSQGIEDVCGRLNLTAQHLDDLVAASERHQQAHAEGLKTTLTDVADFYRSTLERTETALGGQAERLFDAVQVKADGLVASLSEEVAGAVVAGTQGIEEFRGRLILAAQHLDELVATSERHQRVHAESLKTTLTDVADLYRSTLERTETTLGGQTERLFSAVQVKADGLVASLSEGVAGAVAAGSQGIEDLRERLRQTAQNLDNLVTTFEHQQQQQAAGFQSTFDGVGQRASELAKDLTTTLTAALGDVQARSVSILADGSKEIHNEYAERLRAMTEMESERLGQSQKLMTDLDGKIQELGEVMKQFLANAEGATTRLVDDVVGHWQGVSIEFRDNMKVANESLRQMGEIPRITETRFAETLAAVQKQSQQILNETWKTFVSQLQGRFLVELDNISKGAGDVKKELSSAAAAWERSSRDAVISIQDPFRDVVADAKAELAKILEKLDATLAKRYPEVITDAERFTTTLNQMVDRLSEVGKAFEAQLREAKDLEASMKRIPEAAEERLAVIITRAAEQARVATSTESKKAEAQAVPDVALPWRKPLSQLTRSILRRFRR
jgi:hypothetical protein